MSRLWGLVGTLILLQNLNQYVLLKLDFFVQSLKKKDLRIIYAYIEDNIEFIEIYFKGYKQNEDKNRIRSYSQRR